MDSPIGRRLYTLYEIRTGRVAHTVFNESHFSVLDNVLPGWDNYTMSKFNFEEFYKELEKYTKAKNDFYDKLQVPEALRDLHVPENQKNGTYPLGRKFYRLRSGRIIPVILEKGWGFPGFGSLPTFWPFIV